MSEASPEIRITPAKNGGYIVMQGNRDPRIEQELVGAYTSATDLIEAMPEILGTDGIEAVVRESNSVALHRASQLSTTTQKDQTNG